MKIKTRLYLSAVISIILVVVLGVINFVEFNNIEKNRQQHETAQDMQDAIADLDSLTYRYLMEPGSVLERQWLTMYDEIAVIIGEEPALSIRAEYIIYGDLFNELTLNSKKTEELRAENADAGEIGINIAQGEALIPRIMSISSQISEEVYQISSQSFENLINAQKNASSLSLILVIVFAVLISVTSILVARSISGILYRLNAFTLKIAEGENMLHDEIDGSHEKVNVSSDVGAVVDQLMKMQSDLTRSERMATLGQFSGNISHELRNPLGVIDSSVYFLKMKLKDADAKTTEHLNRIKNAVDNSTAIIESLLNLTRMKSPSISNVNLVSIIGDSITTSKLPKTVTVNILAPEDGVTVNGDHEQLRMAFKNIIKNADEAMDGKGTLTVTITEDGTGRARISIKDSGPGIAPDDVEKVFQPLFTRKTKGIGFGLSITQMVIEKHEGSISVRSAPGEGAEFIIMLPVKIQGRRGTHGDKTENTDR